MIFISNLTLTITAKTIIAKFNDNNKSDCRNILNSNKNIYEYLGVLFQSFLCVFNFSLKLWTACFMCALLFVFLKIFRTYLSLFLQRSRFIFLTPWRTLKTTATATKQGEQQQQQQQQRYHIYSQHMNARGVRTIIYYTRLFMDRYILGSYLSSREWIAIECGHLIHATIL